MEATATRKKTLFEIGADLQAINDLIEECDGDISDPRVEAALTEWFKESDGDLAIKIESYINLIEKWKTEGVAATARAELYQTMAKVRENRIKAMKDRMKLFMEVYGKTELKSESGRRVCLQNNGGVEPMIVDDAIVAGAINNFTTDISDNVSECDSYYAASEEIAPFLKATITLDNSKVREHLKAGGTLSFASLGERGRGIRIQ